MNKNLVNTYFPKKNALQNISITENAIKQILFLINVNPDNIGIRLGIKKSGCAGFRYTMQLINNSELDRLNDTKEIMFFYKKILICISSKEIKFLEGLKIDFVQNNINKIFKFNNAQFKKFCGCGESFSIE